MAIPDQAFGELRGDVKAIQKDVSELETDMKELKRSVDGILTQIATVRGGMAVAIWASGFIGAVGMFALTKIAPLFIGFLPKV